MGDLKIQREGSQASCRVLAATLAKPKSSPRNCPVEQKASLPERAREESAGLGLLSRLIPPQAPPPGPS